MDHPKDIIEAVHNDLVEAVNDEGSINAFLKYMNGDRFFPNRGEWDGVSYRTLQRLYVWRRTNLSGQNHYLQTLYQVSLMVQDYFEHKREN